MEKGRKTKNETNESKTEMKQEKNLENKVLNEFLKYLGEQRDKDQEVLTMLIGEISKLNVCNFDVKKGEEKKPFVSTKKFEQILNFNKNLKNFSSDNQFKKVSKFNGISSKVKVERPYENEKLEEKRYERFQYKLKKSAIGNINYLKVLGKYILKDKKHADILKDKDFVKSLNESAKKDKKYKEELDNILKLEK